jgi:hypothetical protein
LRFNTTGSVRGSRTVLSSIDYRDGLPSDLRNALRWLIG